ncbi:unnamed protein product [Cyclocybe aegerita]|uniref:Uncharacterized protein n=1 Tax=Cyclocybe aegerita TaxID=1973307 RepID=A0A8S0W1T4_CYCAE|nr:unnamed protein product [Cyclocybe aegerita]
MFDSTFNLRDTVIFLVMSTPLHAQESTSIQGAFPTLSDLPVDNGYSPNQMDFFEYGPYDVSNPIKHWCLLAEVVEPMPWMRPAYKVKDKKGEHFVVAFHLDDGPVVMVTTGPGDEVAPHLKLPESFSKTVKLGHVMVLMYGQNHHFMDRNKGVRVEDLSRVKVRFSFIDSPYYIGFLTGVMAPRPSRAACQLSFVLEMKSTSHRKTVKTATERLV